MTVSLLIDNDVVIKLAKMDAYVDALAGIGVAPAQVGSLKVMLRYMGRVDEKRRENLTNSQGEADRLRDALQSINELEMTEAESRTSAQLMAAILAADLDIQDGELALCVVAACRGGMDFCTGDKRALRDLPKLERLWSSISQLRSRCICFEQLFQNLFNKHGFARVRTAVTTSPRADETISFVYDLATHKGARTFSSGLGLVVREHVETPAPGWLKAV